MFNKINDGNEKTRDVAAETCKCKGLLGRGLSGFNHACFSAISRRHSEIDYDHLAML